MRLPKSVIFKHCDLFSAGVPDLSATLAGVTTWFEAKRLESENGVVVVTRCDVPAVQWETLRRLGRGYLLIYTKRGYALTHVAGPWRALGRLELRLASPAEVVRRAVSLIQSVKAKEEDDD